MGYKEEYMRYKEEYMRYKYKGRVLYIVLLLWGSVWLTGCFGRNSISDLRGADSDNQEDAQPEYILTGPGSYDSADTALLVKKNETDQTLTFFNFSVKKNYTLQYDGTTKFTDQYGESITSGQLCVGDLIDLLFLKSKKALATAALSEKAWSKKEISRYHLDSQTNSVTIGEELFQLSKEMKVFSGEEEVPLEDLQSSDIVTFQGMDTTVYSIVVEKGHGYLKLSGDESFIGGWIEVGQSIIHPITRDMVLTVPEGEFDVTVSTKGGHGTKTVVVNRGEETTVDISEFKIETPKVGKVLFSLTPSSAEIFVDGKEVNPKSAVELEYGIHQVLVQEEGYITVTSYLRVGEEAAAIQVELEKEEEAEESEEENKKSDVSSGNADTVMTGYRVHIQAPEGAEVYLDGNYLGICPISFEKKSGSHLITLKKSGYETRSYPINLDEEKQDVTYSFAQLNDEGGN